MGSLIFYAYVSFIRDEADSKVIDMASNIFMYFNYFIGKDYVQRSQSEAYVDYV